MQASTFIPLLAVALAVLLGALPAFAQAPSEFYKGRTIELDIGLSVGGGYDAYARMLARTMGKYIPGNPAIVPKNMAAVRRFALGLVRANESKGSVKTRRKKAGWNPDFLLEILQLK